LYLTDLGLAVLAVYWQVEVTELVLRLKLRAADLLSRLPELPHLAASYELLATLAASGYGWPDLLVWTCPWRRRFYRPTAKAPVSVQVPAYAVLAWNDVGFNYLLVPDLGTYLLRIYRPMLNHLLVLRRVNEGRLAPLIIATTHPGRASKWRDLLSETAQFQGDYRLNACVTTWSSLQTAIEPFVTNGPMAPRAKLPAWSPSHLETFKARRRTQRIPCFVGTSWRGSDE
jgi:hypothetical protein